MSVSAVQAGPERVFRLVPGRSERSDCGSRLTAGVSRALVGAAVNFARQRGARSIEGYPMTSTDVIDEELHVGTVSTFAAAGFTEVIRPTLRRAVMRIDF